MLTSRDAPPADGVADPAATPATAPTPAAEAPPERGGLLRMLAMALAIVATIVALLLALAIAFPKMALDAYANWQELTGTGPRGGLLFVEAPQVYTRERLVNDRFDQANWLNHELDVSSQTDAVARMETAARAQDTHTAIRIGLGGSSAPAPDATARVDAAPAGADRLRLEPTSLLDRRLEYRNKVRSELMDTQLDDSHDLDGNTLYRFNFDTVVMPWADVRRYPGTAVFLITAQSTRGDARDAKEARPETPQTQAEWLIETRDNLELLQSWQREIQNFLTKVVRFRIENFYNQESSENKTDPKEDILFEFFLRKTLMNTFVDILSANIVAHCARLETASIENPCREIWSAKPRQTPIDRQIHAEVVKQRRELLYKQLGVEYNESFSANLTYPPGMEIGFTNALTIAHKINTVQWPKLSEKSYRPECMQEYSQRAGTTSADIERDCLLPYSDKGSKRAMIRLIMALEAMKKRIEAANRPLFEVGALDFAAGPPAWFGAMRAEFARMVPAPDDIAQLSREITAMGEARADARSIPLLDEVEASCEAGDLRFDPEKQTRDQLIAYGRCRFLRAHAGKIENIVARFIHQRIIGGQTMFGEMAVTNFVDVDKVGCDVTECRIEVRTKPREDLLCSADGFDRSCDARVALPNVQDRTRDELVRTMTACNDIIENRITPTHAAALAKRERYRFIGQAKDFHFSDAEKNIFFDCVTAFELRNWLEEANVNVAVYEISPHTGGNVVDRNAVRTASGDAGLGRGLMAGNIAGSSEARDREIGVTRVVIGFGQLGPNPGGITRQATFGWVMRPQESVDGRWMPSHYRLSAIISVPSWWKRLKFSIKACWTTPETARDMGFGMVNDPELICQGEDAGPGASDAAKGRPTLMAREFIAQLPRRTEDVTERFRFDFIKAPFLDDQWLASNPQLQLEAGRPGKLVILGGRLWRGTVATVMGRPANKITVLPDMKGVIAEFDCVATPADMEPDAGRAAGQPGAGGDASRGAKVQKLTVWTSEGRTQDHPVEVFPFNPAYGGRPCDAAPVEEAPPRGATPGTARAQVGSRPAAAVAAR
ncbi:hypothetical protein ABLE93_09195 [Xanthobacter sp. KR7-65]|uniref:hypothetical protein n=1 Tax=Xanthobacter sp. KR7-65 TaxID=3156612 RepID=UPI0032B35220